LTIQHLTRVLGNNRNPFRIKKRAWGYGEPVILEGEPFGICARGPLKQNSILHTNLPERASPQQLLRFMS